MHEIVSVRKLRCGSTLVFSSFSTSVVVKPCFKMRTCYGRGRPLRAAIYTCCLAAFLFFGYAQLYHFLETLANHCSVTTKVFSEAYSKCLTGSTSSTTRTILRLESSYRPTVWALSRGVFSMFLLGTSLVVVEWYCTAHVS